MQRSLGVGLADGEKLMRGGHHLRVGGLRGLISRTYKCVVLGHVFCRSIIAVDDQIGFVIIHWRALAESVVTGNVDGVRDEGADGFAKCGGILGKFDGIEARGGKQCDARGGRDLSFEKFVGGESGANEIARFEMRVVEDDGDIAGRERKGRRHRGRPKPVRSRGDYFGFS